MFLTDPPVPIGLPRLAPATGEFMEGFWIPANVGLDGQIHVIPPQLTLPTHRLQFPYHIGRHTDQREISGSQILLSQSAGSMTRSMLPM